MSVDKVQLQQQDVVDNEVVLTDINPVTSTSAVYDVTTGSTMQETLDRVWNSINSMLKRYVNSVNNRTGVVVLDASDVGLGNVDNVSFNDIKEWVIDYVKRQFKNMRLHIYNDMQEVLNVVNTNDASYANATFFADKGFAGDNLSYIGYFDWDESTNTLTYVSHAIRVVGSVDDSIIYNETVGTKNYTGGKLGVNIHPDERALYLESNPANKYYSGLRIDPAMIAHKTYSSKCLYGTDSILSAVNGTDGPAVSIYVDGNEITTEHGHHLNTLWLTANQSLKIGDVILTAFDPYYTVSGTTVTPNGANASLDLMGLQPGYGVVTSAPNVSDGSAPYVINFYTNRTYVNGYGLKYYENHQDTTPSSQLGIEFGSVIGTPSHFIEGDYYFGNITGLNAIGPREDVNDPSVAHEYNTHVEKITAPWGYESINKGEYIYSDGSLEFYPAHLLTPAGSIYVNDAALARDAMNSTRFYGSKIAGNWAPHVLYEDGRAYNTGLDGYDDNIVVHGPADGYATNNACVSVALRKMRKWGGFELLTEKPNDWDANYETYYTRSGGVDGNPIYTNVELVNPPPFISGYYWKDTSGGGLMTRLDTKPNDWETNYTDYYHKIDDSNFAQNTPTDPPVWSENKYFKKKNQPSRYMFSNLSGLALNVHTNIMMNYKDSILDQDQLEKIGIYDGKDAVGNPVDNTPYESISDGLSVNVGKFLEICPKTTGRAENYNQGGRVQVRIGDGLIEDVVYEEIDITEANEPLDWYSNPDRYGVRMNLADMLFHEPIPSGYGLLHTKPDNWDDYYYAYYTKVGDEYFHIEKTSQTPTFVPDTYYHYYQWSYSDCIAWVQSDPTFDAVERVIRTNRIKANIDNETITLNSQKELQSNAVVPFIPFETQKEGRLIDGINHSTGEGTLYYSIDTIETHGTPEQSAEAGDFIALQRKTKGINSVNVKIIDESGCLINYTPVVNHRDINDNNYEDVVKAANEQFIRVGDGLTVVGGSVPEYLLLSSEQLQKEIAKIRLNSTAHDWVGHYISINNIAEDAIMSVNNVDMVQLNNWIESTTSGGSYEDLQSLYNALREGLNWAASQQFANSAIDRRYLVSNGFGRIVSRVREVLAKANSLPTGPTLLNDFVTYYSASPINVDFTVPEGSTLYDTIIANVVQIPFYLRYVPIDEIVGLYPFDWFFNEFVHSVATDILDAGGFSSPVSFSGGKIGITINDASMKLDGGALAVKFGPTLYTTTSGLEVKLDSVSMKKISTGIAVNYDEETIRQVTPTGGLPHLVAFGRGYGFSSTEQTFDSVLQAGVVVPQFSLFIDTATHKLYYATQKFAMSGTYSTDFANLHQITT